MSTPDPIDELLLLAKRARHTESARGDAASFRAFEARLANRPSLLFRHRIALALGTCALLVGGLWLGTRPRAEAPLQYQVVRGAEAVEPARGDASRLRFTDGSSVVLGTESAARVQSTTAHGATVALARGSIDANIVPRGGNDWWFSAGPYRVHVLGTAFALQWRPETQHFEIRMRSGSVTVTGPLAERGISVARGQQLVGEPRANRLELGPIIAQQESTPPDSKLDSTASLESESEAASETAQEATHPRTQYALASGYARLVAEGKFAEVVRAATRAGLTKVLHKAAQRDLAALADAARYEGDDALSRRALLALRKRFEATSDGRAAAYFLGRISRDQQALHWYQTYVREQPEGPFAAPALGALMTLQAKRGDHAASKLSASAYLRRAPNGPYAASARALLAETRSR